MHKSQENLQLATFGAGCFWGVETRFREVAGVVDAAVGYTGGSTENPDYHAVCSGATGHAEVVQVQFDPQQVSYEELLSVFWSQHNPTTLNRQGPDIGSQYRSVIFVHNEQQRLAAEQSKVELDQSGRWPSPVVTTIEHAPAFYRAEEYHQQYLARRGLDSCSI
jgi:peptide-methionine (S)-S-oxide reductase